MEHKQILILLAFLIVFTNSVLAQDINLALGGTVINTQIWSTLNSGCPDYFGYGTGWIDISSRINDGITDQPALGVTSVTGTYFGFRSRIGFGLTATVNRIEVVFRGIAQPGYNGMEAWVYRSTTGWEQVGDIDMYIISGGDMASWQTYTFTSGAPWNDVSWIYVFAYGAFGLNCAAGYFSEIRAWGEPQFTDIGLRAYDGTGVISIAADSNPTNHPLRIYKNGQTYGVVLVDPSHSMASKIRIQTSSGIKALRKI